MGRLDKNLSVTSNNFLFLLHCLRDNLACVAGIPKRRKRGFGAREKREGRARKEKGKRLPFIPSPSLAVSRLTSLPFPFERLPRRPRDNQIILYSYSSFQVIVINFTRCDFYPQNSYPILMMVLPQSV